MNRAVEQADVPVLRADLLGRNTTGAGVARIARLQHGATEAMRREGLVFAGGLSV